jgi:acetyl-CoA C-acetyltransferase
MQTEALGFCSEGQGVRLVEEGVTWLEGDLPVNPSGGVLCTNPIGATGLVRMAEAALQVMGRAGEHQVNGVKTALCHGLGGVLQFQTLMVLGAEPR